MADRGRANGPTSLVLTRQKVPYLGDAPADVDRGAYVIHGDARRSPTSF